MYFGGCPIGGSLRFCIWILLNKNLDRWDGQWYNDPSDGAQHL